MPDDRIRRSSMQGVNLSDLWNRGAEGEVERSQSSHMSFSYTRSLPFVVGLALTLVGRCTSYYVSPSGSDSNNGTSQATAWRTIARAQQIAGSLQPGDQVLFQRGGSYPGQLTVNSNGSNAQPIIVGAYGTGALPEVSGATAVSGWVSYQGNIWRAPVSEAVKYVRVNGVAMTLARFPNSGWLRVNSGSTTQLTSSGITQSSGYWNGARLVVRSSNWSYETPTVSGHTNTSITFPALSNNLNNNNWGFFLCNKLSELDAPGEWYQDAATGQLYLWAPGNANPNGLLVEASVYDNGVVAAWQKHHIKIQDIAFRGQRNAGVRNDGGANITVDGCTFEDLYTGISSYGSNSQYTNNTLNRTYATAMNFVDNNATISGNVFTDIAMHPGLGETAWGYKGIYLIGTNNNVLQNRFENIGYSAIFIQGSGSVERNVITNAVAILNDGGGIHFDDVSGLIVRDNIVQNLIGSLESGASSAPAYFKICHGIYFGCISMINTTVQRNTAAHCQGSGIHVDHTQVSSGNQIRDNILFDNQIQLSVSDLSNYNGPGASQPFYVPNFNDVYSGNVMYCLSKDQLCMKQYNVYSASAVDFGTYSNNRYFNPYNELSITTHNMVSGAQRAYTLERWVAEKGEDAGSTRSALHLNVQEVSQVLGTNMIPNGTFDSNVSGWSGWPSEGQITRDNTYLDNGALRVQFSSNSTYPDYYLRHDAMASVQSGQWYELRFSLRSTMHGIMRLEFKTQSQLAGPQSVFEGSVPFSSERREVSFIFQSDLTEPGQNRFINNYTESTYWMDNVEFRRVQVAYADPAERHILIVNDQATAQEFPLTGCWSETNGATHSGSITLAAFSSIVMVKEADAICGLTTGEQEVTAPSLSDAVYPNPVQAGDQLFMSTPTTQAGQAEIIDTNGRLVAKIPVASGERMIAIPDGLTSGLYTLILRSARGTDAHRLVVQ